MKARSKKKGIPTLSYEKGTSYSSKEKVSALSDYFASVHTQNNNLGTHSHSKSVSGIANKFHKNIRVTTEHVKLISPKEVRKFIRVIKTNKAPGQDQEKIVILYAITDLKVSFPILERL